MISIVRANERHHSSEGWLSTYWHFSFSDYYDKANMGWSALRVFNDDTVAPGGKFGMHPHANFEIITVVLDGAIEHQDSAGHQGTTSANEVQVMTAGKGVYHSEANSGGKPLHLLQIWLTPSQNGLEPHWAQHAFGESDLRDVICPLVSGQQSVRSPLRMHSPATVFRCKLSQGKSLEYPASPYNYLFVISGSLNFNGRKMSAGDSAKIKDEQKLEFKAEKETDFLLFDLPA